MPKLNSHDRFQRQLPMIPSFTSFPSQPQQPDSEAAAPSSKHKSSKKDRRRSKERTRDVDEPEKHRHRHKQRDRDRNFREDDRLEASSSSTTFFSDYKGNRSKGHGGGTDSIRVPKYNLVARTFLRNLARCN